MELSEFLLARIAEDEAAAQAAPTDGALIWSDNGWVPPPWAKVRVLAECEAKRRIVERYADHLSTVRAYRSPRWADAMNAQDKQNARLAEARHSVAEDAARLLALPYANHPDYQPEWSPLSAHAG